MKGRFKATQYTSLQCSPTSGLKLNLSGCKIFYRIGKQKKKEKKHSTGSFSGQKSNYGEGKKKTLSLVHDILMFQRLQGWKPWFVDNAPVHKARSKEKWMSQFYISLSSLLHFI